MVSVEIRSPIEEASNQGRLAWKTRATLLADGQDLTVTDNERLVNLSIPVVDPDTGRQVRVGEDPEAWLRLLPTAFRSGDIVAVVTEDTAPRRDDDPVNDDRRLPEIPMPERAMEQTAAC